jgi:hypothetical protein
VNGFGGGLPVFDVLMIGVLGVGVKGVKDCGINGNGEMGFRH